MGLNEIYLEIQTLYDELDKHPMSYVDYDGQRVSIEPGDEERKLLSDIQDRLELMNLRLPVGVAFQNLIQADCGNDWGMMMHFGMCPCPGVPRRIWAGED